MDLQELGNRIRTRRKELGLMANAVARMAGISRSYLSVLETGKNPSTGKASRPSERTLEKLASILELDDNKLKSLAGYSLLPARIKLNEKSSDRFDIYIHEGRRKYKITNPVIKKLIAYLEDQSLSPAHRMLLERQVYSLLDWLEDFGER